MSRREIETERANIEWKMLNISLSDVIGGAGEVVGCNEAHEGRSGEWVNVSL